MQQDIKSEIITILVWILKSILAGVCIGIGATCYTLAENVYLGAFLFSIGLILVLRFNLLLYTGKIGYIRLLPQFLNLVLVYLSNIFGICLYACSLQTMPIFDKLNKACTTIAISHEKYNIFGLFVSGIFCGMLMFCAVDSYKRKQNYIPVVLSVVVFILCGFLHGIAELFYMAISNRINILRTVIVLLGNSTGSLLFSLISEKESRSI